MLRVGYPTQKQQAMRMMSTSRTFRILIAKTNRNFSQLCSMQRSVSTAASQELEVNPSDQRPTTSKTPPSWKIKMLYDGECPLCMREVNMLKRRDEGKGAIAFVDIADPNYNAADHEGISFEQSMERIHAILPDGRVITDVEVFRRLYEEVGLGWLYSVTKISLVEKAANAVYSLWAKNRLSLTGRPEIDIILQEKKMCRRKNSD